MTEMKEETEQVLKYGTKVHADAMYDKKAAEIRARMCPLRDNTCMQDCVCCKTLRVVNNGPKEKPYWDCEGGYCTAYMLVGPK